MPIGNDDQPDEFRVRARKRDKRCYELALRGIHQPGAAGFLLVHGTVRGPGDSRVGHAWLLDPVGGRIYDPVLDQWFGEAGHTKFVAAFAERRYTPQQAAEAMLAANHTGPWHD